MKKTRLVDIVFPSRTSQKMSCLSMGSESFLYSVLFTTYLGYVSRVIAQKRYIWANKLRDKLPCDVRTGTLHLTQCWLEELSGSCQVKELLIFSQEFIPFSEKTLGRHNTWLRMFKDILQCVHSWWTHIGYICVPLLHAPPVCPNPLLLWRGAFSDPQKVLRVKELWMPRKSELTAVDGLGAVAVGSVDRHPICHPGYSPTNHLGHSPHCHWWLF